MLRVNAGVVAPLLVFAALIPAQAQARDTKAWDTASNIGEGALLAAALGVPLTKGDKPGAFQAFASGAVAFGATEALKATFPENRPDGSGDDSFPSGHTAVSFAAAASLQNRYGWEVGLPAHAAAAFVGLARVEARKHRWYDVVAGAALGEATGLLITSKPGARVAVLPWGDSHGGGAVIAVRF